MRYRYAIYFSILLFPVLCRSQEASFIINSQFGIGSPMIDGARHSAMDDEGNMFIYGFFRDEMDTDPSEASMLLNALGNPDLFLGKYDMEGHLLWSFNIGRLAQSNGFDAGGIAIDADNSVIIAGSFSNTVDFDPSDALFPMSSQGGKDAFIAKYSSNGNFEWAHTWGSTGTETATSLAINAANELFVGLKFTSDLDVDPSLGSEMLLNGGGTDAALVKLSDQGIYTWSHQLSTEGNDEITAIGLSTDNKIAIGAYLDGAQTVFAERNMYLAVTNAAAEVVWDINYENFGSDNAIKKIVFSADHQDLFIGGRIRSLTDFDASEDDSFILSPLFADCFFARYDANGGAFEWARQIKSDGTEDYLTGMSLLNGYLIVAGSFDQTAKFNTDDPGQQVTSSGGQDIFMAAYQADNGSYLSASIFGGSGSEFARDFTMSDGNAIAVGVFGGSLQLEAGFSAVASQGFSDIFFSRIAYDVLLSIPEERNDPDISLYPVPVSDQLFIEVGSNDVGALLSLRIINIVGQEVSRSTAVVQNHVATVNTEDLRQGVYILEAQLGGRSFSKRFIKN